nr:retrovirus-related Pol polyprotein from transposon TNT 1-94 [Tanacetum cinerariifolium]
MLSSMSPDLQRTLEKYNAYDMLKELKNMFEEQAKQELFETGERSVSKLLSLEDEDLLGHFRTTRSTKGNRETNTLAYAPKPKITSPPKRDNLAKDSICHHYKEVGHWRRNYQSYQAELKRGRRLAWIVLQAIRSNQRGEYLSYKFVNHMKSCGIVSQLTLPYTPQNNMVSERRNQTLLDMVRSMINLTTLPKSFWGYALEFTARILNMVPTKKVERTPYKIWNEKAPKLSYLRVWGCGALVKRDTPDKLDPRSIKCIFVGYPKETMGYYFYYPPENKIFVVRNAEYFEDNLIVQEASRSHGPLIMSGSDEGLELIQKEDTQPSKN